MRWKTSRRGFIATIDGELACRDRAKVRRHLAASPQDEQLLADMVRTRNLLGNLPRAKALPDTAEALHQQFERAALLGDRGDELALARRRNRMTQLMAIAAISGAGDRTGCGDLFGDAEHAQQQPRGCRQRRKRPHPTEPSRRARRGAGW